MYGAPSGLGPWSLLAPLVLVAIVILRNARPRTLKVERLWVAPTIVALIMLVPMALGPPPKPLGLALDLACVLAGAALGWWRGRASGFTVDPQTDVVTSRVSPLGMLLLLGILGLRSVLSTALKGQAASLHLTALDVTEALGLLVVAVVGVQRLEWWLRARRMIAAARGAV